MFITLHITIAECFFPIVSRSSHLRSFLMSTHLTSLPFQFINLAARLWSLWRVAVGVLFKLPHTTSQKSKRVLITASYIVKSVSWEYPVELVLTQLVLTRHVCKDCQHAPPILDVDQIQLQGT